MVERYKTEDDLGTEEGERCNRGWLSDCDGAIEVGKGMDCGCYCHVSAPCGYCTSSYYHCPVCDWDAREELGYQAP